MWTIGSVTFILGLPYFQICMHTRTSKISDFAMCCYILKWLPIIICIINTKILLLTKEDLPQQVISARTDQKNKVLFFFPQKKVISCFQALKFI